MQSTHHATESPPVSDLGDKKTIRVKVFPVVPIATGRNKLQSVRRVSTWDLQLPSAQLYA